MNEETMEFDIEFLTQKISENPGSPLFARLADFYLYKQQTTEALSLCLEGLANYPGYYAGYIVLGKIHTELKEYSKAKTAYATAKRLAPFNQVTAHMLRSMPALPDESARTTDENYFTAPAAVEEPPTPHDAVTPAHPPGMVSDEELSYTRPAEPAYESPAAYTPASSTGQFPSFDEYAEQNKDRIESPPAMALDEYLSLSSSPAASTEPAEVDNGIFPAEEEPFRSSSAVSAVEMTSVVEPVLAETMTVDEPIAVPDAALSEEPVLAVTEETGIEQPAADGDSAVATPQAAEEPEMVFASPEQAQLFAEETAAAQETPVPEEPTIDELAERLQNAERIVPQENYRPAETPPAHEEEAQSFETEMVTPTLAEIYASQGEYTAAIQAYEILMFTQPGKTAEFQQRVKELQRLQMEKDGTI